MEDIDGGLHPAVDGQSLGEKCESVLHVVVWLVTYSCMFSVVHTVVLFFISQYCQIWLTPDLLPS